MGKKRFLVVWLCLVVALFLFSGCSKEEVEVEVDFESEPVPKTNSLMDTAGGEGLTVKELCSDGEYFEDCVTYGFKDKFRYLKCKDISYLEDDLISYNDVCLTVYAYSKEEPYLCEDIEDEEYNKMCFALHFNKCPMEENEIFNYILFLTENEDYMDSCEKVDFETLTKGEETEAVAE
jgi:hypothetical protein